MFCSSFFCTIFLIVMNMNEIKLDIKFWKNHDHIKVQIIFHDKSLNVDDLVLHLFLSVEIARGKLRKDSIFNCH